MRRCSCQVELAGPADGLIMRRLGKRAFLDSLEGVEGTKIGCFHIFLDVYLAASL